MKKKRNRKTHPMSLAKLRYARHKAQSKFRNIEFNFTFEEWYQWWMSHGVDKNVEVKWTGDYRPCMCRYNDLGAYEATNVYFANHIDNVKDANETFRQGIKVKNYHKSQRLNYRWGDELVSADWLKTNKGLSFQESFQYFRTTEYDKARKIEFKKLKVRYLEQYGSIRTKTRWQGQDGWYLQRKEAAQSYKIDPTTYSERIKRGIYEKRILGPTLWEFIQEHTRYPDPYWPQDLDKMHK